MNQTYLNSERNHLVLVALAAAIPLYFGWQLFWFLTDDAFISFRYVSNSVLGHGYVWNAAPFKPVEGYSNFLWVVLLDIVWRSTGIEPPLASNYLSLGFSYGSLVIGVAMIAKLKLNKSLQQYRAVFAILMVVGVLSNRTFLAWTSSGLETALFNFLLLTWVFLIIFGRKTEGGWLVGISLTASLLALTRPDGMLYWLATLALIFAHQWLRKPAPNITDLWKIWPLLLVPAHLLWRKSTYDEWLPNTYFAKVTSPWPESGIRYLSSYILEYALWVWLILVAILILRMTRNWHRTSTIKPLEIKLEEIKNINFNILCRLICTATILVQLSYYTFIIGGDHFEYRVYSFTPILILVSFIAMLSKLSIKSSQALTSLLAFMMLSLPIPWTHWLYSQQATTRLDTYRLSIELAPKLPRALRWYGGLFDNAQSWLIERSVCMRHQEHKIFAMHLSRLFPPRELGLSLQSPDYPVHAMSSVGVAAWTLPHVNFIDKLGLNDYVIARMPVHLANNISIYNPRGLRQMAHDRRAPMGYIESFQPNILREDGGISILNRDTPLTAEKIAALEEHWIRQLKTLVDD